MSLDIILENSFKSDYKRCIKRGYDITKLDEVIELLASNKGPLPTKYKDHKLIGNYVNCRDCHIENDWLLVYKITTTQLTLSRTGTHSDLF